MEIRQLAKNEAGLFQELIDLFGTEFEMDPFPSPDIAQLRVLLQKDHFLVFVAMKEGSVIGGLTVYRLDGYYTGKPAAYIYDLAVKNEFQGQGIGKQLMAFTREFCREERYEEMFVQADGDDENAIHFYRRTRPDGEESAVHFTYRL
ncbi:GNAT family N-acetyltransferase [Cyclobacterium jeungdonense]|uniref:GNAT family N-acetyltransferase n=1 Tax=Cyclobacterium jeungdonense TaxID=708087 RepID=A0ABT8C8J1_9BACT|nr:GNAT family N-acetyltransferase [Cyclobacterium jeungdonense]MDN3689109.1 GNAT family N-acetyltransferase [Cyclobacterium jeungdonense]